MALIFVSLNLYLTLQYKSLVGAIVFPLLFLGFAISLAGVVRWRRPGIFAFSYIVMWFAFILEWLFFGTAVILYWFFPFMYAPYLLGSPLWIVSWTDWRYERRLRKSGHASLSGRSV